MVDAVVVPVSVGAVSVLFASVSVVLRPTTVSDVLKNVARFPAPVRVGSARRVVNDAAPFAVKDTLIVVNAPVRPLPMNTFPALICPDTFRVVTLTTDIVTGDTITVLVRGLR